MKGEKYTIKTLDRTDITFIQFGNGRPSALLVAGIHGDEKTGTYILNQLADKIKRKRINGSITLIPVTNPRAAKENKRLHPDDGKDLNRNFSPSKPSKNNTPTNNLAKIITAMTEDKNLVVDIHVFPNQISPIVGIFLLEGNKSIQKRSNKLLHVLQPDIIWLLDTKKTEPKKAGSLCSFALQKNIPAFGIELPPDDIITGKQMHRVTNGLERVLSSINIIDGQRSIIQNKKIIKYERRIYRSKTKGLFTPKKEILFRVRRNEVVGEIKDEVTGKKTKIISPAVGILLTISCQKRVSVREKLFVIGKKY